MPCQRFTFGRVKIASRRVPPSDGRGDSCGLDTYAPPWLVPDLGRSLTRSAQFYVVIGREAYEKEFARILSVVGLGEALALILIVAAAVGGLVGVVGTAARSLRPWVADRPGLGYAIGSGVVGIIGGTSMLIIGGNVFTSGWACLTLACGVVLLVGAVLIAFDIDISPDRETAVAAAILVALAGLAALYLTHPAEDLPRLIPGHDSDSQQIHVLYGLAVALVALLPARVVYITAAPHRRPDAR